jgi:REP element-mobilizing transposase RayT
MWNDTDEPLAYLISFRSYGTWLHGDERGSIDRHHNVYGTPKISSNIAWESVTAARAKHEPVYLDAARRKATRIAIEETCAKRGWTLMALNVRTNHGHLVVLNPGKPPDSILSAFKANATRHMRESGCWSDEHTPWAAKGSKRRLWNAQQIANAINYVENGQGDDLPESFD